MTTATLSDRELATTLAALRAFQNMLPLRNLNAKAWLDISTDSGRLAPLSVAEVEDLCWKLNRPDETNEEEEAPAPTLPPEDLTTLPAGALIVRLANCFGSPPSEPNFAGVLAEVGRRLKDSDFSRDGARRAVVSSFAYDAVNQIWRAHGGRALTGDEPNRLTEALFDFFKTVR